jgi:hypothetical protein
VTEPGPPDQTTYHTTVSGGQVNIGGANASFTQHNYAPPASEFRETLATIERLAGQLADPALGRQQILIIRQEIDRSGADRRTVEGAIGKLANQVTAGTALATAVAKAGELVARHWPF